MRHRRWVVVLAVFVLAVVPLLFLGLKVGSRHPAVKRVVLSRIIPDVPGHLTIGELEMGLASLRFTDISLELRGGDLVMIPSAVVNVSLARLMTGGLMPERSLSTIIVTNPRFVINYGRAGEDDRAPGAAFDVTSVESYLPDYLGVSDATVVFRDERTGRTLTVNSIDFLLERKPDEPLVGGAIGSTLGGEDNLEAEFSWDDETQTLSVEGQLTGARLTERLPVPPSVPVEVTAGTMTASFRASASPDSIRGLDLTFEVADCVVAFPAAAEELVDVDASGRLVDDVVTLEGASGRWRSATWTAAASVMPGSGVIRDMTLSARDVDLTHARQVFGLDDLALAGTIDAVADVEGTFEEPLATVAIISGTAEMSGVPVTDVGGRARVSREAVEIEDAGVTVLGGRVSLSVALLRAEGEDWTYELSGDASDLSVAEILRTATGDTTGRGTVSANDIAGAGTLARPRLESLFSWNDVAAGPVKLGSGAGGFLLADGDITASFSSPERTYTFTGRIEDVFDEPVVDAWVDLSGLELGSLRRDPVDGALEATVDGGLDLKGPADAMAVAGEVTLDGSRFHTTAALAGTLSSPTGPDAWRFEGSVESEDAVLNGVALPFVAELLAGPEELAVRNAALSDFAELNASIGLGPDRPVNAGLVVSEAELPELLGAILGEAPEGLDGLVFASASLHGPLARPVGTAQVSVGTARVASVAGLDATAVASLEDGKLSLREFVLREDGLPVVTAEGEAVLGGGVAFTVVGDGIPGPLLGGGADTRFDVTVGIGGTTDEPTFDGRVESASGEFLGVPFDTYSARFTGADGLLRLEPLVFEKRSRYRATADGTVPYSAITGGDSSRESTLRVEVDGNPIAFLSELADVGESGSGRGTMSAVLVGDGGSVTVASARLEAVADRVTPVGLFEHIDNFRASVSVRDGAVVDGVVSGTVDGNEMTVRSERLRTVEGRELAPLTLGGVDAGVLALSTEGSGVTANVPGLMLPDESGRVALRGRDGAPDFLIAGPSQSPFLWGEIRFSDGSFTYPFIGEGEGDFGDLLSDAEWAIRMSAGRNLWYWRPDANLNVERDGWLDFLGRPSDHTLCVSGRVASTRGTITYLHTEFDVREIAVDFPSFCEPPRFYLDAETRVADGTTISLSMNTSEEVPSIGAAGVTLDESTLVLASDSPDDNTPEKISSKLQYGVSYDLLEAEEQAVLERRRAVELVGTQIGLLVARPLLSPIESRIRRGLNLDLVRIDIDFVEHFLAQMDLWNAQLGTSTYVPFMADTRMTLGKYISRDWLVSYLGVVEPFEEEIGESALGLRSEFGIEYEVSRNTSLSLRVVYDPSLAGWDRRVSIENRYEF